jgi:hypothetical protein
MKPEITSEEYNDLLTADKLLYAEVWQVENSYDWNWDDASVDSYKRYKDYQSFSTVRRPAGTRQIFRLKPASVKENVDFEDILYENSLGNIGLVDGEMYYSEKDILKSFKEWKDQDKASLKLNPGTPKGLGIANGIDPCPFCGCKEGEGVILGQDRHRWMITCTNCNVRFVDDRKDKVQSHWNRRTPADLISKQQVIGIVDNMKIKTDKLTGPDRILNTILDEVISKIKELKL